MKRWIRDVITKWRETHTLLEEKLIDIIRSKIKEAIEKRHKLLRANPKKMINNILTRWFDPIILDQIVTEYGDSDTPNILIHLKQIKKETALHFYNWMKDPNPDMDISPE